MKIISSREIFFVIVEFLIKIDELLTKIDDSIVVINESLIDELLVKFEISIKIDEFSMIESFEIETKYETIVWNVLTNFLKRVLFIVYSSNQIRVSSKSINKNKLRIRRLYDSMIKIRKCRRQMFSTINFVDRLTKLSYWCSISTKFLNWWANMTISRLIYWLLNNVNVFVKFFLKKRKSTKRVVWQNKLWKIFSHLRAKNFLQTKNEKKISSSNKQIWRRIWKLLQFETFDK